MPTRSTSTSKRNSATARRKRRDIIVASSVAASLVTAFLGLAVSSWRSDAPPDPTVAPTEAPTDAPVDPVTPNEHGNIDKAAGETFTFADDDGADLVNVTVTAIHEDFTCPAPDALPPANGQYIALDVQVAAGSAFDEQFAMFPVNDTDFVALNAEGTSQDSRGNAAACLTDDLRLAPVLTSGQTLIGTVVLDVTSEAESVTYLPGTTEWSF